MNVLLVNGGFPDDVIGGSELQTRFIGECLVRAGHVVHYAAISTSCTRAAENVDGMVVHRWVRDESVTTRRDALRDLMRTTNAQVVYCRIITWLSDVIEVADGLGIPVVASIASDLDLRRLSVWRAVATLKVREARGRWRLNRGHLALPRANVLVAQTATQAIEARRLWGIEPTTIANFWPDLRPPVAFDNSDPYAIWVGSIKQVKRPDRFLQVAAALKDTGIRSVMVGPIQNADHGSLVAQAAESGLVEYRGALGLQETWDAIARSVALVNTSEAEGFANTFIQAWLSGVPVVSLGVDPDGVIVDRRIGAVCDTPEHAAAQLDAWVSDPGARAEIGARAREHALAEHSADIAGARFVRILEDVASRDVHS